MQNVEKFFHLENTKVMQEAIYVKNNTPKKYQPLKTSFHDFSVLFFYVSKITATLFNMIK